MYRSQWELCLQRKWHEHGKTKQIRPVVQQLGYWYLPSYPEWSKPKAKTKTNPQPSKCGSDSTEHQYRFLLHAEFVLWVLVSLRATTRGKLHDHDPLCKRIRPRRSINCFLACCSWRRSANTRCWWLGRNFWLHFRHGNAGLNHCDLFMQKTHRIL